MRLLIDDIPIDTTNWLRLENLSHFIIGKAPQYHPGDPRYTDFWSLQVRRSIEGCWGKMFGKWRYMRPNLYYYGNFTYIQDTDINKRTSYVKPSVSDLEWEISYGLMVARGFSGFESDQYHTCLLDVDWLSKEAYEKDRYDYLVNRYSNILTPEGKIKTFIDPLQYVRGLHDTPFHGPLYQNETKNFMIFGTRGGGKSYSISLGEVEHSIIFDGATRYDDKFMSGDMTCEVCVGAFSGEKSSEFCDKIRASINAKADPYFGKPFGVWGTSYSDPEYRPSVFYRKFTGDLSPSNKENPYRYDRSGSGRGRSGELDTTKLFHVNYSPSKARDTGTQAASGGRYLISVIEECGLLDNIVEVHATNTSTVSRDGVRFGVEVYLGTSGNVATLQGARRMFLSPDDYNILSYYNLNKLGKSIKTGFFIPFYMTLRQFKDKNGNTDFELAARHVNKLRDKLKQGRDLQVLIRERMNRPCVIDEMWLSVSTSDFPVKELQERELELMEDNLYQRIGAPVKLFYDSSSPEGVSYSIEDSNEPFYDFPLTMDKRKSPHGCVVIYEHPMRINGKIPKDLYIFGHDPYVQEDVDKGGSLGAVYVFANPKYIPFGLHGNVIVASYIDKPVLGMKHFYENVEKLIQYYGNGPQSLWYESNFGQDCRSHFISKNKLYLLAPTPQHAQGNSLFQKNTTSTGYRTAERSGKQALARMVRDWLLTETEIPGIEGFSAEQRVLNLKKIPCIFLVRQLILYNLDDNFDAFDAFRGCILGYVNESIVEESNYTRESVARMQMITKIALREKYKRRKQSRGIQPDR